LHDCPDCQRLPVVACPTSDSERIAGTGTSSIARGGSNQIDAGERPATGPRHGRRCDMSDAANAATTAK
jgi:hypothetical protein